MTVAAQRAIHHDMTPSKEVGASAISTRLLVKPWCVWPMQVWTLWNRKRMLLYEPSKFVIGNGLIQPSSDDIVKAHCSCVDGSAFPERFATNCRGLHYSPVAPNFEVEEEEEAIDRSLLGGACHTQLLTSFKLQHCQKADVLMGCH